MSCEKNTDKIDFNFPSIPVQYSLASESYSFVENEGVARLTVLRQGYLNERSMISKFMFYTCHAGFD